MQFDRVIRAKVLLTNSTYTGYRGEIDVTNFRMTFSILKTFSWSTNTADIRIFNLGADNRNRLREFGDQWRLFAGYRDNGGAQLLFTGNVTQLNHQFEQPEIITHVNCGDGERSLNNTLISVSFGSNTPVRTVIQSVADQMNFPVVDFAHTENFVYPNGFNDTDLAKNVLDNACKKVNLRWSVQNDNLVIIADNGSTTKPAVDINADTGMIGIPERYVDKREFLYRALSPNQSPKPGWKVRLLLRPDLLPGDKIRLRSTKVDIDGTYVILTVRHEGDNWGPLFITTIEVFPL